MITLAVLAGGASLAHAEAQAPSRGQAAPRVRGVVPANVVIPSVAESGTQTFEFGDCATRRHATAGWVCTETGASSTPPVTASARRHARTKPRARAAEYRKYSFSDTRGTAWGIGSVVYGQITWERGGSFNGSQHNIWQAGTVISGAHRVRYDFNLQAWRQTSTGSELREVQRNIVPAAPGCQLSRARQPTWPHVHTKGHDYYMTMYFKLRDCTVSNPSTPDGTWISAFYSTRTYHCVEASTGSCYFKGF